MALYRLRENPGSGSILFSSFLFCVQRENLSPLTPDFVRSHKAQYPGQDLRANRTSTLKIPILVPKMMRSAMRNICMISVIRAMAKPCCWDFTGYFSNSFASCTRAGHLQ
jgi:hypothetical protein